MPEISSKTVEFIHIKNKDVNRRYSNWKNQTGTFTVPAEVINTYILCFQVQHLTHCVSLTCG